MNHGWGLRGRGPVAARAATLGRGQAVTVRTAAHLFLDSLGNPNTVRNYGIAVSRTAERLGEGRPFAPVEDGEVGEVLESL